VGALKKLLFFLNLRMDPGISDTALILLKSLEAGETNAQIAAKIDPDVSADTLLDAILYLNTFRPNQIKTTDNLAFITLLGQNVTAPGTALRVAIGLARLMNQFTEEKFRQIAFMTL